MSTGFFPLGDYRQQLFNSCHDDDFSLLYRTGCYLGHKAISVITVPMDVVGCVLGGLGMVGSACTLGAFKVFLFAISLGNIKCTFSSGFPWFSKRTVHCITDLASNIAEFFLDGIYASIYVCDVMMKVAAKLHLSGFIKKIVHQIEILFDYIGKRLQKGFHQASLCESKYGFMFSVETPSFLKWIDTPTSKFRIDELGSRPLSAILVHSLASLVNIPLNATASIVGMVASTILTSVFVGKAFLVAATNIHIPVPTALPAVFGATLATTKNVLIDSSLCVTDVAILTYKVAKATGLIRVVATIKDLLLYIPRACFQ